METAAARAAAARAATASARAAAAPLAAYPAATGNQMALLTRLVTEMAQARLIPQRPKAVNCRVYKLGQSWPDFSTHFYAIIKTTYNFNLPGDKDALDAACCNWLPSKLEPGPTMVAYQALDDAVGDDWDALRDALKDAFEDDTERVIFS